MELSRAKIIRKMRVSPRRTPIARARLSAGLQQKEMAAKIGISQSYLQKVELGVLKPSLRLQEIAKALAKR
jgi:predicted transcriptional regulator